MKTVTSCSGGKTSSYIAANYPADHFIFSLVRTADKKVAFKDKVLKKMVEDKLNTDFVGTLENDSIITTMFELEQFIGKEIEWVTGDLFENIIKKATILPCAMRRFCTTELKMKPIFHWWREKFDMQPVAMNIGYRRTEQRRAKRMLDQLNDQDLSVFRASWEKCHNNRNIWHNVAWRKPQFPLIDDYIDHHDVNDFWKNKPVTFAAFNNCIGCPNFTVSRLKYSSENFPEKFQWFVDQESKVDSNWKKNITYAQIQQMPKQLDIFNSEIGCDSGFCGM